MGGGAVTWPTYRLNPAALPVFDPSWQTQCRACRHLTKTGPQMRCTRARVINAAKRAGYENCIDARAEGGVCGPTAKEFFAKEKP